MGEFTCERTLRNTDKILLLWHLGFSDPTNQMGRTVFFLLRRDGMWVYF